MGLTAEQTRGEQQWEGMKDAVFQAGLSSQDPPYQHYGPRDLLPQAHPSLLCPGRSLASVPS